MRTRLVLCLLPMLLVAFQAAAQGLDGGLAAFKRRDYAGALKVLGPLAAHGNGPAQYHLGLMYEYGWGVGRDYRKAVKWYRKAADQGDTGAQLNLNFIRETGRAELEPEPSSPPPVQGIARKAPTRREMPGVVRIAARDLPALKREPAPRDEPLAKVEENLASGARKAYAPAETPQGAFRVQLSSVRTLADAFAEARRLSHRHRSVLGNVDIALVRVDLGPKGVYYRLRAGPMADRAAADTMCRKLSADHQSCLVIGP